MSEHRQKARGGSINEKLTIDCYLSVSALCAASLQHGSVNCQASRTSIHWNLMSFCSLMAWRLDCKITNLSAGTFSATPIGTLQEITANGSECWDLLCGVTTVISFRMTGFWLETVRAELYRVRKVKLERNSLPRPMFTREQLYNNHADSRFWLPCLL